ncbi:ABC transporter substrate-binding protein [Actinomadura flavalba]|uniref:ABC transporter substrate-binding protein n=1 Tax=Actinomadura flavalba TaxID=1120938 RepID=UPI0003648093|nr:ABC transporter substrate-binding protein [Actinomadura flavalba]
MFRPRRSTLAVLAAVLPLTLSACGGDGAGGAAAGGGAPVQGGTLTFAVNSEPLALDPHTSPQDVTAIFTRPILDSLVSQEKDGTIKPWLATSWEISPDQRSYTFKLRQDVKFTDGTPFDAAAVKANLDHIVDPKTKSQLAASQFGPYQDTEVVDRYTAKVNFERPHSPFLNVLSTVFFGIHSPKELAKGPAAQASNIVGSGPFLLEKYTAHQSATYRRNPDYRWAPPTSSHQGPARLDRLEIKMLVEDSVRYGALTSGQVDAILAVPPSSLRLAEADKRLKVDRVPVGTYSYFLNTTHGVFTDPKVRDAFRSSVDFKTLVDKLYFGAFTKAYSPLSPQAPGYDKGTESQWGFDAAKANRLLDEAGWTARDGEGYRTKDGKRLTLRWPILKALDRESRVTLSEQVQAEVKKVGFHVDIQNVTFNEYLVKYGKAEYDLLDYSMRADADSLRSLFDTGNITKGPRLTQNAARYSDKEVDGWFQQALASSDAKTRLELYEKVQQKVIAQSVVVPVYVQSTLVGRNAKVGGITFEPQGFPLFQTAWIGRG